MTVVRLAIPPSPSRLVQCLYYGVGADVVNVNVVAAYPLSRVEVIDHPWGACGDRGGV